MNILDRYLLREYLRAFAVGLCFFIALVVIVRLLDYDLKKFEDDIDYVTASKIVLFQAPRRIMEMVPIAAFVAVFFTFGRMVRSNEFTAMKAGGISVYRILVPILVVTLLICALFAIFYDRVASPPSTKHTSCKTKSGLGVAETSSSKVKTIVSFTRSELS